VIRTEDSYAPDQLRGACGKRQTRDRPPAGKAIRISMKAVVVEQYDTIDNIPLKEVALPDVAAGQVRVKVQAASIGFVDGLKVQGLYQTKDALPFTPGMEFAGVINAAGAGVT